VVRRTIGKRLTLQRVNRALAESGYREILVKGRGGYHFVGGDTPKWPRTKIAVRRLNQLATIEQWINARNQLADYQPRLMAF
jgi:hypothetical protein